MKRISDFKVQYCSERDSDEFIDFAFRMKTKGILFLPKDRNYLFSKYRNLQDESKNLNLFILRYKNKKIVGCSGYVPFDAILNGKSLKGFIGTDGAIDPQYRKQYPGLVPLMAHSYEKFIRKDKLFPLVAPDKKATVKTYKEARWDEFAYAYEFYNPFLTKFLPTIKPDSIALKKVDYFDKEINHFFKKISSQHAFLMHSDYEFLNKKYVLNPYRKYTAIMARKNKTILGYIVVEKNGQSICIVDITVDLDNPWVILLLLYKSLDYFDRQKIKSAVCYLSHRRYIEILRNVGFVEQNKILFLFFRIALLFSQFKHSEFYSSDRGLYHFNGFAPQLY